MQDNTAFLCNNNTYGVLPTPTRSGYTFTGWYTANSGGTQITASTHMGVGNATVYAQWNAVTATVSASGTYCTVSGQGTYQIGCTATLIATYDASTYGFLGWYDSAGNCITTNTTLSFTVTCDVTYVAKATAIQTVSFDCSGTVYFWGNNGNESYRYTYNLEGANSAHPENKGYAVTIPSSAQYIRVTSSSRDATGISVNGGTYLYANSNDSWTKLTSHTGYVGFVLYTNIYTSSLTADGSITYQYY